MKHRLFVGIVVVLLLSHCVLAGKIQLLAASVNVAKLAFAQELQTGDDIQLRGSTSISVVDLRLPPRWRPSGPGSLHLFVRHSPGFDGDKSFLTVTLNYALLRSIRLDETNAEMSEITVPVPSSSIRQTNELVLGVEQVDAKGAPLTVIASRSFFEFPYIEIPLQWDLGHLRTNFSSGSVKPSEQPAILLPVNPSSATLEATALVVGLMGRSVDSPRALRFVRRFNDWNGPLFVIGTPSEQPELVSLQGAARLVFHRGRKEITVSEPGDHSTNKTDGYIGIALNARYRMASVIFVTGNSPAAVLKAAKALASPNWTVARRFARITGDTYWPTLRMREWEGFIPPTNSFHLSDLAHSDIQVGYPEGATIPLRVPPDARFLDYGHEVTLKLTLSSQFYVARSYIVVKLNGSELERYPTDNLGGLAGSLRIGIPAKLLRNDNTLKVSWQGPAAPSVHSNIAGWISRDTEFYLPRNYEADLPDLALLRKHLYPFSIKADFSDVIFVVADRANFDCVSALLAAVAGVAPLAPSEHIAPRIARSRELNNYDLSNFHLVFLNADESGRLPLQVAIASPSTANTARMHQRVWEITSPWSSRRCVLVISARTAAELLSVTQSVFSLDKLNQLTGDAAFFYGKSTLCLHLRHRRNLADVSYNLTLQSWLREHWLLLPIVATGFSGALFAMLRIALRRNRRYH